MNRRAFPTSCLGQRSDSFQVTFPECHSQWSHCGTSHSNVSPWPSLTGSTGAVPHTATRGRGGLLGPLSPQSGGGARRVPCRLLPSSWRGSGKAGLRMPPPSLGLQFLPLQTLGASSGFWGEACALCNPAPTQLGSFNGGWPPPEHCLPRSPAHW